jgi:hypothetical protein
MIMPNLVRNEDGFLMTIVAAHQSVCRTNPKLCQSRLQQVAMLKKRSPNNIVAIQMTGAMAVFMIKAKSFRRAGNSKRAIDARRQATTVYLSKNT